MSVAFTNVIPASGGKNGNGSSFTYTSYAVSGTQPAVIVLVGLNDASATVTSVITSAGLTCADQGNGANHGLEIKNARQSSAFSSGWSLASPSGTGTITVNLSATVDWQSFALLMANADQTTPCPTGDAIGGVASGSGTLTLTLTPSNLTGNDASVGCAANTTSGNPGTWTNVSEYSDGTTTVNLIGGYTLGTGTLSGTNIDGVGTNFSGVGLRVQAPTVVVNTLWAASLL